MVGMEDECTSVLGCDLFCYFCQVILVGSHVVVK